MRGFCVCTDVLCMCVQMGLCIVHVCECACACVCQIQENSSLVVEDKVMVTIGDGCCD